MSLIAKVLESHGADLSRVSEVGWRPLRCPYHDDKQASASVNLNLGGFRCHACGMRGDALKLIQEKEGVGYKDAVAIAEALSGERLAGVRLTTHRTTPRKRSKWRDTLSL